MRIKLEKTRRMRWKQNSAGGNDVKQNTWPTQLEEMRSRYKGREFVRPS